MVLFISDIYIQICVFTVVVLLFSSCLSWFLIKKNPGSETLNKVRVIIKSWWYILGTLLVFGFFGPHGFLLLFTGLNILIVREYLKRSQLFYIKKMLAPLLYVAICCQAYFLFNENFDRFVAFPVLYFITTFPPLLAIPKSLKNLPLLTASYLCVLLLTHGLFYLPAFILVGPKLFGNYESTILTFFIILGLIQANDVFQFICGKSFGRKKLVPHLSPNKTEAGFVGGITTTT